MKKNSKGFMLVEVLTGMILQAGLVLMLCGAFYVLLEFGNNAQKILTARERGRRVIEYIDSRVRHAGLGLRKCKSSEEICNALQRITPLRNLQLPVAITDHELNRYSENKITRGNFLTLLYAQREVNDETNEATSRTISLLITPGEGLQSKDISAGSFHNCSFLSSELSSLNKNIYDFTFGASKRSNGLTSNTNIKNWAALRGEGLPVVVSRQSDYDKIRINVPANTPGGSATIYAGEELLYLNCERMYARFNEEEGERSFYIQDLTSRWGERTPHEIGILEIYFELVEEKNILYLWVLSSGGESPRVIPRPSAWPSQAPWEEDFSKKVLYVSRASWKLRNIPEGFEWN